MKQNPLHTPHTHLNTYAVKPKPKVTAHNMGQLLIDRPNVFTAYAFSFTNTSLCRPDILKLSSVYQSQSSVCHRCLLPHCRTLYQETERMFF